MTAGLTRAAEAAAGELATAGARVGRSPSTVILSADDAVSTGRELTVDRLAALCAAAAWTAVQAEATTAATATTVSSPQTAR